MILASNYFAHTSVARSTFPGCREGTERLAGFVQNEMGQFPVHIMIS